MNFDLASFLIGLFLGGFIGVFAMAIAVTGRDNP